jgi:ATP-dependent DNA ligase
VLGPDGFSRFEEFRRREAADTAILAFDLIEQDGEDMRNRPFLDRKEALVRLLRGTEAGCIIWHATSSLLAAPILSLRPISET